MNENEILKTAGSYRTERFCSVADRNIVLSVENQNDGSEKKTCHNDAKCKKKNQCKYYKPYLY